MRKITVSIFLRSSLPPMCQDMIGEGFTPSAKQEMLYVTPPTTGLGTALK